MPVATPIERIDHPVGRRRRVRFYLVFWIFILSAISFLDRTNVSIAGPQLSRVFALGNQQLGWIFSAFLVGYASFQVPAGMLAVRFGPRRVITFGVMIWAVCNVLTSLLPAGVSQALLLLIALRCALGLAEAVIFPSANQFVARWVPQKERGIANGLIFAGVGAGSGLTPPILTWIILTFSWRAAFWFDAGLGVMGALVWWIIARDHPEDHPLVTLAEQQEIREGLMTFSSVDPGKHHLEEHQISWRAIFSRIDLAALMVSYFAYGYTSWLFFSWFYLYMVQARHLDLRTSAMFSMLPFLCMTVCCLGGGILSDRLTRRMSLRAGRCMLATIAMFLTAILLVVGSRVHGALAAATVLAMGAGSLYISQSSFWSAASDIAGKNSGIYSAIVNMSCQIGAAITVSLTPWLAAHFNWKMPFTVAAVIVLIGSFSWLLVHPERALEL
jgi:ACS family glucarate transporter-like MFS transporter